MARTNAKCSACSRVWARSPWPGLASCLPLSGSIARVYTYSAALDLASADTVVAKLQRTARYPVHYVDGGWQTIVDGLREAALQAGATVRTASGADAIRLDDGRAIA